MSDQIRAKFRHCPATNPGRHYSRLQDCKIRRKVMEEDEDLGGFFGHHPGMTGMMGRGYGHHGWQESGPIVHSTIMRILFGMMDASGDGKLSLEEWQAAHERIFIKAMDTNHDGTVSFEEMEAFLHGR
jgi:EF hand domain-containing protein